MFIELWPTTTVPVTLCLDPNASLLSSLLSLALEAWPLQHDAFLDVTKMWKTALLESKRQDLSFGLLVSHIGFGD